MPASSSNYNDSAVLGSLTPKEH
uniref:Uncharacterized protein n=1 Tax=Arundo donax TaxID=35708 RepID=A0A0A9F0Q0_ARUDO